MSPLDERTVNGRLRFFLTEKNASPVASWISRRSLLKPTSSLDLGPSHTREPSARVISICSLVLVVNSSDCEPRSSRYRFIVNRPRGRGTREAAASQVQRRASFG